MRVAVFAGSNGAVGSHVEAARALGEGLAAQDVALVYGGGRVGLMGALADGALQAGGSVIGVMPRHLVDAEIAHPGLTELVVVTTMHERKQRMADLADAFCALPGGAGTLEEWFEAWTWQQLGLHRKPVALIDVDGFWQPLLATLNELVAHDYLRAADRDTVVVAAGADDLLNGLATWRPAHPKWRDDNAHDTLETVAWVHVEHGHLLTVRTRGQDAFYLPGGKLEPGESHPTALRREVREELGLDLDPTSITPLTVIDAPAHGRDGQRLRMHCYTAQATGTPATNSEVDELCWLGSSTDPRCAPAVAQLLRYLAPDL
ncbi:TIGR00730 family Rossman fold protein [Nocardioides sp. CFH 31398]|uniref:TIGR00730 family Rossman fold protein n=1 Tax=Nocardioides sp. CFH 31398 TaxID=2919579 RepID=UPI001F0620DE|nr:TIGR00730 family Rossman fold protein [Nocardioides sp. CFH 31398]MCH1866936.1 TIGR00730 family Rossman fold protein [Nocardioides sp. CFH 31398]